VILVDTSALIEFERASGTPAHQRLHHLIQGADDVAVTEPIVAEFVVGAQSDKRELELRNLLDQFVMLSLDGATDFDGAVRVYRRCRKAGVTPRGLFDCLIAAVALREGVPVLSHDADLARIAQVVDLQLDEASFQPATA
jgi:predicted nucleic acid-binding protein